MEQLAEALGVTAGAVYKWEAKLSLPELHMILEMADFFDTSVDVLLGYKMKDNRWAATVQQLKEMLTFANAAAAIVTTRKGALRVMPSEQEILDLMEQAEQ